LPAGGTIDGTQDPRDHPGWQHGLTTSGTVTPIATSTNTAEKPIKIGGEISAIAVTP
jgi:hypothetical protein